MPETSGPPHRRVSSLGRTLAAGVLLDRTSRDLPTILAVIDGTAHLVDADDPESTRLLLTLAADDPATAEDALSTLTTPAPARRTPTPGGSDTAGAGARSAGRAAPHVTAGRSGQRYQDGAA